MAMKMTLSVSDAQAQFAQLALAKETIKVTSHDETVAFIVPRERMEALLETMEILSNKAAVRAIRRDQSGRGKYIPVSALDEDPG